MTLEQWRKPFHTFIIEAVPNHSNAIVVDETWNQSINIEDTAREAVPMPLICHAPSNNIDPALLVRVLSHLAYLSKLKLLEHVFTTWHANKLDNKKNMRR